MRMYLFIFVFLFFGFSYSQSVRTVEGDQISLYVENDARYIGGPGTDESYSNGFKISYLHAAQHVPFWAKPFINWSGYLENELKNSKSNFGIAIAQQIYTPSDTAKTFLLEDDRPYAAWLYLGLTASFNAGKDEVHSLELDLGIIGPEAHGKSVQNGFHRIFGMEVSQGWENQLKTEPALLLSYSQRRRFFELIYNQNKWFDLVPYYGGSIGNILVSAYGGALARLGYNLQNDFGPTRPSATEGDAFTTPVVNTENPKEKQMSRGLSFYGFAGLRGNVVVHDIFLDGNTFQESHHVTKNYFYGEGEVGLSVLWSRFGGTWRFVSRSPQFKERSSFNSFASITASYLLD